MPTHATLDGTGKVPSSQLPAGSGGSGSSISGVATLTGGIDKLFYESTVSVVGVLATNNVIVSLAHHTDSDENCAELLDVLAMSAEAGIDSITFRVAFGSTTSGNIKLNYMVI